MNQIYYYSGNSAKKKQLDHLCRSLQIGFHELTMKEIGCVIGSVLAGMPVSPKGKDSLPPFFIQPELLLFQGFSDSDLDRFLAAFRAAGIEPVPLKAIATPYNLSWTFYELTQTLLEERKTF